MDPDAAADDADQLAATLAFLREAGRLKDTVRSAHTIEGRPESVAEHTWRLCLMVVTLADRLPGIDAHRLLELAVVHDLGEAIHGDVPATEQREGDGRAAREREDLHALTEGLPRAPRERLRALWQEYEDAATPEARLAKGLDKLETILTHVQGANPPDFDHDFNLGYGRERTDAQPLTRALRAPLDDETRRLAGRSTDASSVEETRR